MKKKKTDRPCYQYFLLLLSIIILICLYGYVRFWHYIFIVTVVVSYYPLLDLHYYIYINIISGEKKKRLQCWFFCHCHLITLFIFLSCYVYHVLHWLCNCRGCCFYWHYPLQGSHYYIYKHKIREREKKNDRQWMLLILYCCHLFIPLAELYISICSISIVTTIIVAIFHG